MVTQDPPRWNIWEWKNLKNQKWIHICNAKCYAECYAIYLTKKVLKENTARARLARVWINWNHLHFYKRNPFKNESDQKKSCQKIEWKKFWKGFLWNIEAGFTPALVLHVLYFPLKLSLILAIDLLPPCLWKWKWKVKWKVMSFWSFKSFQFKIY